MKYCQCGCRIKLRSDNKTGYQRGHKPCPVCGTKVQKSNTECCCKSCSAKLHHQRHPEMAQTRYWNAERFATRNQNKESWIKSISDATLGRESWNKGKIGAQIAWNKGLPSEEQPFFGKTHSPDYFSKNQATLFKNHGITNCGLLAKTSPRSKKEKLLERLLPTYQINQRVEHFRPDFVNYETMHIIELYGDYWHCNPKFFSASYFHPQIKMCAEDKWKIDADRVKYLENLGYTVTIIWEADLLKITQSKFLL